VLTTPVGPMLSVTQKWQRLRDWQAPPQLDKPAIAMVIWNVTFVKPGDAVREIFVESFGVV
jgi:hypothetical protein